MFLVDYVQLNKPLFYFSTSFKQLIEINIKVN